MSFTLRASNPESARRKSHAYNPETNRSLCGRDISAADRYSWRTLSNVDCGRCLCLLESRTAEAPAAEVPPAQLKRQATIDAGICLDEARMFGNDAYLFVTEPERAAAPEKVREQALECIRLAEKAIEYAEVYRTHTARMYARQARMTIDGARHVLRKLDEAQAPAAPRLERVEVTDYDNDPDHVLVSPVWGGVDRPNTGGTVCHRNDAPRLVAAIEAGAVYPDPQACTDLNGQTYVPSAGLVLGRHLDLCLRRLGF